jgi:hypothetical protein
VIVVVYVLTNVAVIADSAGKAKRINICVLVLTLQYSGYMCSGSDLTVQWIFVFW